MKNTSTLELMESAKINFRNYQMTKNEAFLLLVQQQLEMAINREKEKESNPNGFYD